MLENELCRRATDLADTYISLRREIHSHPEYGFEETQTSALIRNELQKYEIELLPCSIPTAVIGLLKGAYDGPTLALRADIDCLPIHEESLLPFSSQNPERCHACGHDIHTTSLLLAARLLSENRNKLHGSVKFIFQPAEEGLRGSRPLIEDHVLEAPSVDAILGLHVSPELPAGTIGWRYGPMMASSDRFYITLHASGGHAAHPEHTADPILAASLLITQLQTIVSRELSPFSSAVVTVGKMIAGTASNIIPSEVRIEGTVRSFSEEVRAHIIESIQRITDGIALSMNLQAECNYVRGSSPVINDASLISLVAASAKALLGEDHTIEITEPSMEGEDFAFYLDRVPGAFFRIGTVDERFQTHLPLHNPQIIFNEDAIVTGGCILSETAFRYLSCEK